ncbi:MAG: glycosyltransferase [Candidatus Nanopelagicales bacterium]|nr:glycosyltransferase [Candidatus Nanopelagicales bacterium]
MPHVIYLAIGFPPAAKSCSYRMKAVANAFARRGWDVTAVSLKDAAWEWETGLDLTLLEGLSPRVVREQVDLERADLDPDIRKYSRKRALDASGWLAEQWQLDEDVFPERYFGRWLGPLTDALKRVHASHPGDLLMVSPAPYVTLGAALEFCEGSDIPLAVDYRDGWSIDVIGGEEAFPPGSRAGVIERSVLQRASRAWFVNDAIKGFYSERFPDLRQRFRVVRNGYDSMSPPVIELRKPGPLRFGYLGNLSSKPPQVESLLKSWRIARLGSPLLADSTFEFLGHVGTQSSGMNANKRLIAQFGADGVSYGGPVAKGDVAASYRSWDVLVFPLIGGPYMTSGKVYEYMATGLPIASAHDPANGASEVLRDYPLWARNESLDPGDVAEALITAAEMVRCAPEQRVAARRHAETFERRRLTDPALADLIGTIPQAPRSAVRP